MSDYERGNLAKWVEKAANGQPILGAVIGEDYDRYSDDDPVVVPAEAQRRVLSWEGARPLIDYEFDSGFGGADCNAVYAWTASRVIFIHEYDGATDWAWVPRNPADVVPQFDGSRWAVE